MAKYWIFGFSALLVTLLTFLSFTSALAAGRFVVRAPIDGYLVFVTDKTTVPHSPIRPNAIWREFAVNSYSSKYVKCQSSRIQDLYSDSVLVEPSCSEGAFGLGRFSEAQEPRGLDVFIKGTEQTPVRDPINLEMLFREHENMSPDDRSEFWHHDLCKSVGAIGGIIFSLESPLIITEIGNLLAQWHMVREMNKQISERNAIVKEIAKLEAGRANAQISIDIVTMIPAIERARGTGDTYTNWKPRWEGVERNTRDLSSKNLKQAEIDVKISSIEADMDMHSIEVSLKSAILSACAGIVYCPAESSKECEVLKKFALPGQYVTRGDPIVEIKVK